MISFREFLERPDYIIVRLPTDLISEDLLLNEGKWMPSNESGWMQRVDAANPAIPTQRHVHVARDKHTSSRSMQAAWNADGTRHDRKTFNDKIGTLNAARSVARAALGLSDAIVLEQLDETKELQLLEESAGLPDEPLVTVIFEGHSQPGKIK